MAYRCSDTLCSSVVESYGTTVREWQLQFALALLACHTACHRTVNLVCEPILTCHRLKLKHVLQVICQLGIKSRTLADA